MKEWKGNSDSVRGRLSINKAHTTKGREADDFYATDPKAVEALINAPVVDYKQITQRCLSNCKGDCGFFIWECAAGNGYLSNWLKQNGYNVVASDLKYRGCTDGSIIDGLDFLTTYPYNKFKGAAAHPSVILTNPPYSLANEFILHALNILPDGGVYIALMNISYLCGQKRYETIYSKGTLREVYLFRKRIECWRNNDKETYGGKAMVDFAWYVFQKGYKGQPTLYWL